MVEQARRGARPALLPALNGARILILGLAYKKNVDDVRESPALTIMEILEARGAETAYHDPYLPEIPASRRHSHFAGRRSIHLIPLRSPISMRS